MDNFRLFIAIVLIAFINSCTTYYYVVTDVDNDLNVERRIYASSDDASQVSFPVEAGSSWKVSSLDVPFVVDFYDVSEEMTHMAECRGMGMGAVSLGRNGGDDTFPGPDESVDRRFRWFYTYYDYRAVFSSLRDRLPLPFDGYLTDKQQALFFVGDDPPEGWNGIEMYYLLDDICQNFARWHSDATYDVMCEIFIPFCTDEQAAVLETVKERFMEGLEREALFAMQPDEFDDRMAMVAPDSGFGKIYERNAEAVDMAYEGETEIIDCFENSFLFTLNMPGKYIDGNAQELIDGIPSWKVDAFRLLYGDMILEATSRTVNLWAFILTFAVIALLLQLFAKGLF